MECMTLAEIFATTIFSVKLMHDCTCLFEIKMIYWPDVRERFLCGMARSV